MPGSEEAIHSASQRGYEAVLLCVVVIGCLVLMGTLIRWLMTSMDGRLAESKIREERLAQRVTALEVFAETTLLTLVKSVTETLQKNTEALAALTNGLNCRPCMFARENQEVFIDKIIDKLGEKTEL